MLAESRVSEGKGRAMATIDVDALREYMEDYCGTAMFGGFPAAVLDLAEVESMDGYKLCQKAESMGIDLRRFQVDDEE